MAPARSDWTRTSARAMSRSTTARPSVMLHVHGEAPLAAIDAHEGGALLAPVGRRPGAGVVAPPPSLHLDHLRPHVAEDLGAGGAGHVLGQVGDKDSGEGSVHGRPIIA